MTFGDALFYLFELSDREDPRFHAAAARWHARFVLDAQLDLADSEMMINMLCGLKGPQRHIFRRRLLQKVERAGLTVREIAT